MKKAVMKKTIAPFFADAKKKAGIFEKNPPGSENLSSTSEIMTGDASIICVPVQSLWRQDERASSSIQKRNYASIG